MYCPTLQLMHLLAPAFKYTLVLLRSQHILRQLVLLYTAQALACKSVPNC
jgi:hypothetical protein